MLTGLPLLLCEKGVLKTFFYNFSTISTKFDIIYYSNDSKGIKYIFPEGFMK